MARVVFPILSLFVMPVVSLRRSARRPSPISTLPISSNVSFPQSFEVRGITSIDDEVSAQFVDPATVGTVSTVYWILKKAAGAASLYMKANNVKLALKETNVALEEAAETVERMGTRLIHAHDYFLRAGLPAFLQCIEGEKFGACARADFSHAGNELESAASELDDVLGISHSVVIVMKAIRSIADDANKFSEGLLDVHFDIVPLEKKVEKAAKSIHRVVRIVKLKCSEAKAAVDLLVSNTDKEYMKEKAQEIFDELVPVVDNFEIEYKDVVKPLMLDLAQGVEAAYQAARRLYLPVEAPESVANETIDRSKCSWRQTRWFKSIEAYNVDIEKTMVCDTGKTLGKWFKCWCATANDCYVSNKKRPEPVESRRCFKRV